MVRRGFVFFLSLVFYIYGDGAIFIPPDAYISERFQVAFISWDGEFEELVILPSFSGKGEEFLWVVPLPDRPAVDTFSMESLKELNLATYIQHSYGYGCTAERGVEEEDRVNEVMEKGVVGIYGYEVWYVEDVSGFVSRLDSLGFNGRDSTETWNVINRYMEKGWRFFMVVTVKNNREEGNIEPLLLKFRSQRCVYPLYISSIGSDVDVGCLLIVASDEPLKEPSILYMEFSTELTDNRLKKLKEQYPSAYEAVKDRRYLYRFENLYLSYFEDIEFEVGDVYEGSYGDTGLGILTLILLGFIFRVKRRG